MTDDIEITRSTDVWSSEDFIEPEYQEPVEDDPWGYGTLPWLALENDPESGEASLSQPFDGTAGLAPLPKDDLLWGAVDAYEVHYGLEDVSPTIDGTENIDTPAFEEPEPEAEGTSDLRQSLYDQYDRDLNISQKIKINEFIAALEAVGEEQVSHISELLEGIGNAKVKRWLPWLRDLAWTGSSLLLFLEFRIIWEHTPQWWETSFWSDRDGWRLYYDRYSMSLDDTYELTQSRLDCSPDEVIDKQWVEEWENQLPWKYGFPSFASFVLFRSGLDDHVDWQLYCDYEVHIYKDSSEFHPEYSIGAKFGPIKDVLGEPSSLDDENQPFYEMCAPEKWFTLQDFYDQGEWHDDLGWSTPPTVKGA